MNNLLASSKRFINRNASTILTCVGGVGVVATTVMAVKATPKVLTILKEAEEEKGQELTRVEKIVVAAPSYIPAALTGAATIACIVGANILNKKQQAGLASAYAMLDVSYKEYRKKVDELYGENADAHVREEISKDKYKEKDIPKVEGKQLFFDEFSGRFFYSTIEKVQQAEYLVNRDLVMQYYSTLNDYYGYLGIPHVDGGHDIGWSTTMNEQAYWQEWVDFSNEKTITDDGDVYYIIRMFQEPMVGFEDFGD